MPREQRQKDYDATIAGLRKAGSYKVQEPEPEPEPELGLIGKYSPAVVRGIGGLIGSAPGIGAVAGGVSELGAEGLENYFGTRDDLSWKEIGAATALGAVGGGMVSTIGHAATPAIAALRAGSLGAASPFVRSALVEHELPDWEDVALQGGIAALTGGAIKHITGRLGAPKAGAVTPTGPTGLSRLLSNGEEVASREVPLKPPPLVQKEGTPGNIAQTAQQAGEKGGNRLVNMFRAKDRAADVAGRGLGQEIEAGRKEYNFLEDAALKERAGELQQDAARAKIDSATQQGMQKQESISESFTEKVPGGSRRLNRRFVEPAEETGEGGGRKAFDIPTDADLPEVGPAETEARNFIEMLGGKTAKASPGFAGDAQFAGKVSKARGMKASAAKKAADPRYADVARPSTIPAGVNTLEDLLQTRPGKPVHIDELAHLEPSPAATPAVEGVKDRRFDTRQDMNPEAARAAQFQFGMERLDAAADAASIGGEEYSGLLRELDAGAHPDQLVQKLQSGWRPQGGTITPMNKLTPELAPLREAEQKLLEPGSVTPSGVFAADPEDYRMPKDEMSRLLAAIESHGGDTPASRASEMAEDAAVDVAKPVQGTATRLPPGPDYSGMGPAEQVVPMGALKKSPGDVSADHYKEIKGLLAGGEIMPKEAPRVAGRALQRIGNQEAAAAPKPAIASPTPQQAAVGAPQAPSSEVDRLGWLARAKEKLMQEQRPGRGQSPLGPSRGGGSGWGSEGGFADPAMLSRVALGAGGALLGGALNQDDPIAGALMGGAAGAVLPAMVAKFAQHLPTIFAHPGIDEATKMTLSSLGTPEGIKEAVTGIVNRIPAYLRANLLYSPNLLNNAVTGPYGAAVMAAMERAGAGDPRGVEFLKILGPSNWGSAYVKGLETASSRLAMSEERAGGGLLSEATNPFDKYTALPGTLMGAGDEATRALGMSVGFTEEEMRAFTLTSEPETAFGKSLANIPRSGGLLGQTFAPFMRTAVNSMEQGAFRTPGAGYLFQALRENPDPMAVQHIQQLMGVGAGVGGYELGQHEDEIANAVGGNDPTFNPMLRKLVSGFGRNVAGPYSTIASAGYAGGKAFDKTSDAQRGLKGALNAYVNEAPLPSASIPLSYVNAVADPGSANLPSGFVPQALKDYLQPKGGHKRPQRPKRPGSGS